MKKIYVHVLLALLVAITGCFKIRLHARVAPGTDVTAGPAWNGMTSTYVGDSLARAEFRKKGACAQIRRGCMYVRRDGDSEWACYDKLILSYKIELRDDLKVVRDGKLATPDRFISEPEEDRPNQALQHNDRVCHGLCRRTLRASHGRG